VLPFSQRDLSIPAFLLLAAAVPDREGTWPPVSLARVLRDSLVIGAPSSTSHHGALDVPRPTA